MLGRLAPIRSKEATQGDAGSVWQGNSTAEPINMALTPGESEAAGVKVGRADYPRLVDEDATAKTPPRTIQRA